MRKLSPEEQTGKIGFRVKKAVLADFYAIAAKRGFSGMEGRFFEVLFNEWKATQPALKKSAHDPEAHRGTVTPRQKPGRATPKEKSA